MFQLNLPFFEYFNQILFSGEIINMKFNEYKIKYLGNSFKVSRLELSKQYLIKIVSFQNFVEQIHFFNSDENDYEKHIEDIFYNTRSLCKYLCITSFR